MFSLYIFVIFITLINCGVCRPENNNYNEEDIRTSPLALLEDKPSSNSSERLLSREKRAKPSATVTVYQHSDYGGDKTVVYVWGTCSHWSEFNPWDDNASMIVLQDYCFRFWSHKNCEGHSYCFCYSSLNLKRLMRTPKRSWDDEISAFSECGFRSPTVTTVTFYDDRNFQGGSHKFLLQKNECLSFFPGDWRNDAFSSVKVTQGCVEYFTDAYCRGRSYELKGEESYVGDYYDNEISSIRPC